MSVLLNQRYLDQDSVCRTSRAGRHRSISLEIDASDAERQHLRRPGVNGWFTNPGKGAAQIERKRCPKRSPAKA
jgi:hypothetical protein